MRSGAGLLRRGWMRTFLRVDGLSNDFSHIQQPCFFSRGRGPPPSCLDVREDAARAEALRIDWVMSEGVAGGGRLGGAVSSGAMVVV